MELEWTLKVIYSYALILHLRKLGVHSDQSVLLKVISVVSGGAGTGNLIRFFIQLPCSKLVSYIGELTSSGHHNYQLYKIVTK